MRHSIDLRILCLASALSLSWGAAGAQLTSGAKMPGFAQAFGIDGDKQTTEYSVDEIGVRAGNTTMANVLWPGDKAEFALRFLNKTHHEIKATGKIVVEALRHRRFPKEKFGSPMSSRLQMSLPSHSISICPPAVRRKSSSIRRFQKRLAATL